MTRIFRDALSECTLCLYVSQKRSGDDGATGKLTVQPFVHVKSSMSEVLERVCQDHRADILKQWHHDPVDSLRSDGIPDGERGGRQCASSEGDLRKVAYMVVVGILRERRSRVGSID